MSIHKLSAGSGYDYLTRQVAALDATGKGHVGLASYYTERGESPGVWVGSGMAAIDGLSTGDPVTAEQMRSLFGAGMHPLATQLLEQLDATELTDTNVRAATQLGLPFKVYSGEVGAFRVEVAKRIAARQPAAGQSADERIFATDRARVRTEVAREFFRAKHGRDPIDAREIAATIAKESRPRTQTVAGYDLTFSPVKSVSTLWAVANPKVAVLIEQAHQAAVQDALGFIERHALFTRQGRNGVRQVNVRAVDPALELAPDERWAAAVYGKQRVHSTELRRGIARAVALLGVEGDEVRLNSGRTVRTWAEGIVGSLLNRANEDNTGQLWQSLSDVLPLLAEAAPDQFLRAVQEASDGSPPLIAHMFEDAQSSDSFSVSSAHSGLLWALETIAWSEVHFALAVQLLARLAEIDPGGRLSNRPANSLADIFLPWFPQTRASADARLIALDRIWERYPDVARLLSLQLLPDRHAFAMHNAEPTFRDWSPADISVSVGQFWRFTAAVAERLLAQLNTTPSYWPEMIPELPSLPPDVRDVACEQLAELSPGSLAPEERRNIWEAVGELLRRHREFPDAEWAMPEEDITRIEEAAAHLRPESPRDAQRWLFDDYVPDIGMEKADVGYHQELARLRASAASSIYADQGLNGLSLLAADVEVPQTVGTGLADAAVQEEIDTDVLELLAADESKLIDFAMGYARRLLENNPAWVSERLAAFSDKPIIQARLLNLVDDLPAAWRQLGSLGRPLGLGG